MALYNRNEITITPKMRDNLLKQIEEEGLEHKDDGIRRMALILKNPNFPGVDRNIYINCKARVNYFLDKRKENKNEYDYRKPYRPEPDANSGISEGDIEVGRTLEGNIPVMLKLSEFTKHFCVAGITGCGKTSLLISILEKLIQKSISVVIFDRKGGQFSGLQKLFPDRVLIMKIGIDKFLNFNGWPKNCNRMAYLSRRSDYRARIFERHDSQILFNQAINNLLSLCDPKKDIYFSEYEINKELQFMKMPPGLSIRKDLKSSQLSISNGILESPLAVSFDCCKGIIPGELARKGISLIIETFSVSNKHELLIETQSLNQAYTDLQSDAFNYIDELRQVFVFDEGGHIFTNDKATKPILELQSQVRFSGIGCMVGTTNPSALANSYQSNVFSYFAFHLFNTEDIWAVKQSMFLTSEQTISLAHLPQFVCVTKLADRYTKPFLMKVGGYPIES